MSTNDLLDEIASISNTINQENRRVVVETELRPKIEELRSSKSWAFRDSSKFQNRVKNLEYWAKQISKRKEGANLFGKIISEIDQLRENLKSDDQI